MTAVGVTAPPLPLRDGGIRLPLSDLVVVGLFALVLFVALDPFAWRLLTRGLGRWGPFAVGIPLVALAVFGRLLGRLRLPEDVRRETRSLLWPTVAFGLLVLSSPDAQRFNSGMGTDFLQHVAEIASAALGRLR